MAAPIRFWGRILAVRPRLVLAKFEGETTPHGTGYVVTIEGTRSEGGDPPVAALFTVALGPAIMAKRVLGVGDLVRGEGYRVLETTHDTPADLYRVTLIRVIARAESPPTPDPPRTDPPHSPETVGAAQRRPLAAANLDEGGPCTRCPHALIVCTVLLDDPRDYRSGQWFRVPACLGPADCPHYRRDG